MKSHMQIPAHQGKLNPFVEGEGSWEDSSTQSPRLFIGRVCEERSLSSSCWALLWEFESSPFWSPDSV